MNDDIVLKLAFQLACAKIYSLTENVADFEGRNRRIEETFIEQAKQQIAQTTNKGIYISVDGRIFNKISSDMKVDMKDALVCIADGQNTFWLSNKIPFETLLVFNEYLNLE